ncbi:MAG: helix-turn-helix domain-containing protein [Methyloligellaceae bacterium]
MAIKTEAILRSHRLFSIVSEESFTALARSATSDCYPSDTVIAEEGAPADHLLLVVSGATELFTHLGRRETSISIVQPFAVLFVAAVMRNEAYPLSARTIGRTRLIKLPAIWMRAVTENDPALSRALMLEMAGRYTELLETLKNQKLRRSVHRLARYLVHQHEDQGAAGHITLPVRKQTLASLLGITPSALSRAFTSLRPHGVTVNGYEIELSNPGELRALANESACPPGLGQAVCADHQCRR